MTSADAWFFSISFGIIILLLLAIRDRIKRIEEKIDKMSRK